MILIFKQREKHEPRFRSVQLVRTAVIEIVFSKRDSTNWSDRLYTKTQIKHDTILPNTINYLPERYNEDLLKSTNLPLDENNQVMKKLNFFHENNNPQIDLPGDELFQKIAN